MKPFQLLMFAMLSLILVFLLVVVALPNTELAAIRREFVWLSRLLSRMDRWSPGIDMVHVLMFAGLGGLARLALARAPWCAVLLGIVAFSALTELLQFWAPGRNARWSDFVQDAAGALLGIALATGLLVLLRGVRGKPPGKGNAS